MKNIAIILASGSGLRVGSDIPKQFIKIADKTILEHSIDLFETHNSIDEIIVVSNRDYLDYTKQIISKNNYKKVTNIIAGGATRKDSSYIGISSIQYDEAKVLIHDAVRPFVTKPVITECLDKLDSYNAVTVAIESTDTLVEVNSNNIIQKIPERKFYRRVQTPQGFKLKTIRCAHELAKNIDNLSITDDCGLITYFKLCDIYVVKGEETNIKITYPIDIELANKIYQLKICS